MYNLITDGIGYRNYFIAYLPPQLEVMYIPGMYTNMIHMIHFFFQTVVMVPTLANLTWKIQF